MSKLHIHVHIHLHDHRLAAATHAEVTSPGTLPDRLLRVLRAESVPHEIWDARHAYARLRAHGWETPSERPLNVVGNALVKLLRAGHLVRIARGAYQLAPAEYYEAPSDDDETLRETP